MAFHGKCVWVSLGFKNLALFSGHGERTRDVSGKAPCVLLIFLRKNKKNPKTNHVTNTKSLEEICCCLLRKVLGKPRAQWAWVPWTKGQSMHPGEDWDILCRGCGMRKSPECITCLEQLIHQGTGTCDNWWTELACAKQSGTLRIQNLTSL